MAGRSKSIGELLVDGLISNQPAGNYVPSTVGTRGFVPHQTAYSQPQTDEEKRIDALVKALAERVAITAGLPAHNMPTYYSKPIDQSANVTMAAAVATYTDVITYTVPNGSKAVLTGYGVNVRDATYAYDGTLQWRILVNGQGAYADLLDWSQQRGSLVFPRKMNLVLEENYQVKFQVQRTAVGGYGSLTVDQVLTGYTWLPKEFTDGAKSSVLY